MRLEFSTHLYATHLAQIPLFRGLGNSVIHTLCGIVEPMLAVRSQVIYSEGSVGKEMYILICGELEVTCNKVRLGFLSDGAFFGETPLLEVASEAERRRRTVTAMTACKLCFITQDALEKIMPKYPELALRLKRCARFSKRQINRKGKRFKLAQEEAGLLKSSSLLTKSLSLGAFGTTSAGTTSARTTGIAGTTSAGTTNARTTGIAGTTSAPYATGNDSPDNTRPPGLSSLLPALSASALSRRIDELQQVVARMDARAEDTAKSVEQTAKSVETILQHLELRAAGKEAV